MGKSHENGATCLGVMPDGAQERCVPRGAAYKLLKYIIIFYWHGVCSKCAQVCLSTLQGSA